MTDEEDDLSLLGETLLLDLSFSLELDLALDDDFAEEEDFTFPAELLLDLGGFAELLDFTLLLESVSERGMTEEEDRSSSFGETLLLLSSPHATRKTPNIREIATHFVLAMTFRIRTPSPQWSDLSFDKYNLS